MTRPPPSAPDPDIQRRIARWRRSGRPAHLWPDLDESVLLAAHRAIWDATVQLLRGAASVVSLAAPASGEPRPVGIAAFRAGMGPLLGLWIETGRLSAAPPVAALLAGHLDHARRRARRLDAALGTVLRAMADRGIVPTLLKGAHTGRVHFEEPACRVGADLDLLVQPTEFRAAQTVLTALGYHERSRSRAPVRSVWYPGGSTTDVVSLELEHADNPWSVDLHCSLERRYFRGLSASMNLTTLARQPLTVAGQASAGLDDPHLAAYLALHGSRELAFPQLIRVVELVLVTRRASAAPGFWPEVHACLSRQGLYRFVAPMFVLAEEAVPGALAASVLAASRAALTPRWRRWLDFVLAHGLSRPHRRTLTERLVWANGWKDTLRIASDLAWHGEDLELRDRLRLWSEGARTLIGRRDSGRPS